MGNCIGCGGYTESAIANWCKACHGAGGRGVAAPTPQTETKHTSDLTPEQWAEVGPELRRALENLLYAMYWWRQGGITVDGCVDAEKRAHEIIARVEAMKEERADGNKVIG